MEKKLVEFIIEIIGGDDTYQSGNYKKFNLEADRTTIVNILKQNEYMYTIKCKQS